ncbi:PorP/SprF family type IX secretion system membrane protein [Cellulophaga baltica]|uniref:Membrane protein n=1 Tax=Cellulophaga baltica 18 TaxID=1348584 RepID=A0AAU8RDR5_9FLAO|nr:type IX secretion system membrane protein PorP/SprF [Cellulophaga baltica]AIZ40993.1 membrane protein [Cellulophaga baltica 18]
MLKKYIIYLFLFISALTKVSAQDDNPFITYDVPSQNLLKFNRFLLNPTFSTVREDKSYINLLHRNQSATFNDNNQTYFLSYSGRMSDRTGLGLSLYSQQSGAISNYGILANYAYGIKLSDKSNFTFGANFSYYRSGYDSSRGNTVDPDDPLLSGLQNSNLISFQPGFNLSYGRFDFGVFAENLFDYNIKTNESVTEFGAKTYSGHLQYTYPFDSGDGVLEGARLMPLLRVKKGGEKYEVAGKDFILGGSLILDLPKLGWAQAGYDSYYGAAAGIGFNLNKRISIGYTMEKGLSNTFNDFGLTHEISFAYSITPNLTEDRVLLEDSDELADIEELKKDVESLTSRDEEIEKLKAALSENDEIVAELMFRQDSIEASRNSDLERRFDMVMRMVRRETNGENPDLEEKAKQLYLLNNLKERDATQVASNTTNAETDPTVRTDGTEKYNNPNGIINPSQGKDTDALVQNIKNSVDTTNDGSTTGTSGTNGTTRANGSNTAADATASNTTDATNGSIKTPKQTQTTDAIAKTDYIKTPKTNTTQSGQTKDAFTEIAKKNNIKSRKFRNLEGVNDGYYVVANVYKSEHYMNKFIDELKAKGINADYFENKNNGLKYVYLIHEDSWDNALSSYKYEKEANYTGDLWIMNVDNANYTDTAYANNSTRLKEKSAKYNNVNLRKNVIEKDNVAATGTPAYKKYNLNGVDGGYYIIANVFASPKNANNFVKLLNSKGLNASYFINPENNYRYVYLKKHGSWNNALMSYYSKINNAYDQKMWIMKVSSGLLT